MTKRWLLLALLVAAIPSRALAQPAPDSADDHFRRGVNHFQLQDFEAAASEFKAAYQAANRDEYLFAWAQAERLSGDCPSAIALYKKLLDATESARDAARARDGLEQCRRALAGSVPLSNATPTPTNEPSDSRRALHRDPIFWGLAGTGAAALIVGASFGFHARSLADSAESAQTAPEFERRASDFDTSRRVAWIATSSGVVLAAGTVVYALLRQQPRSEPSPYVSGWLSDSTAGLVVGWQL